LVHLVEHWCASPRRNNGTHSYASTLSLFSPNSALHAVAAVPLLSTSGRHSPITSGPSLLACLFRGQQGKSDQLRRNT
jgi:hypothetical protein